MSFSPAWLDLRAAADAAARDRILLERAARHLAGSAAPVAVDLGSGTGATVGAFAGHAPGATRWRLVDHDEDLLALARARCGAGVETFARDLRALDRLPLDGARLVTASALLDLMPEGWVADLVGRLASERIALYAALSYDGTMHWTPELPGDAAVTAAFNAHQRGDKGLGPALGPDAAGVLASQLAAHGYKVATAPSPWRLEARSTALQDALLGGIGTAAAETGLGGTRAWVQARRAAGGATICVVGHVDVFAVPPPAKSQSNTTSVSSP